ncbi:hypothetical protein Cni_G12196 [Canna indica]|uniref:Uncharacterized protein n=1 Tax=Canna indica TaxID=4628 RepID=A0AAQ3KD33_9LILI|nr:hypothetical protein Cni_G12196 [Canna indica]
MPVGTHGTADGRIILTPSLMSSQQATITIAIGAVCNSLFRRTIVLTTDSDRPCRNLGNFAALLFYMQCHAPNIDA